MTAAERGVSVGRDALGNGFVTGDGNTIEVKLSATRGSPR